MNRNTPRRSNLHSSMLCITRCKSALSFSGRQLECIPAVKYRPAHARVLRRNGHDGFPVADTGLQLHGPSADRIGSVLGALQDSPRTEDQQHAQLRIARLRDSSQPLLATRAVLPGHQAQPGGELAAALELLAAADHRHQGWGGGGANATLLHQLRGRFALFCNE